MTPRCCWLPDVGCIEVHGADAQAFLHGQLSQDIAALGHERAPLAGWHDARGRLRALFRVLRTTDGWLLVTPRDMLDTTLARLRMFVLRADVTLSTATGWEVAALVGVDDAWLAEHGLSNTLPRDGLANEAALHWVRVGADLVQVVGAKHALEALARQTDSGPATLATLAEIQLGIPAITPALSERFVPQMLNLDQLGAISFTKGCYPGQEVIARVRNLGSVKRRARRYAADVQSVPAAGTEVFANDDRAVGEVVRGAPAPVGIELLCVVEHDAAQGELYVGADERPRLIQLPLPYEVPPS